MDDQAVQSVADADATCLGIVDDFASFFFVAVLVEIDVADTGSRLDNRHTGMVADKIDQRTTAPRNDKVHQANGVQQLSRRFAVGRKERTNSRIDALFCQYVMDDRH